MLYFKQSAGFVSFQLKMTCGVRGAIDVRALISAVAAENVGHRWKEVDCVALNLLRRTHGCFRKTAR